MTGSPGASHPVELLAGWARWAALAAFSGLVAIGLLPMHPTVPAAAAAAALAIGAAVLLVRQQRPLLLYAAAATGGIAVLGFRASNNVGWIGVCLIGLWCALAGSRRDAIAFLAGALVLFTTEWIWFNPDPGWGAWIAGSILVVLVGRLGRRQIDLVAQLEEAQAGLAERARAEERNRIGRDLHDVIAHTLTVALLHITSARLAVEYDPDDAARALAEAERLARESLDEVRLVVGTLHQGPDGAGTRPLPGAAGLPSLVDRFRSAGVDVALAVDGDTGRLHATTGLAVYRILQEALTNAIKHAAGAAVSVRLTVDAETVRLAVDTAGEPGPDAGTGLGVISMRERAESLGGSCSAGPGGQGWLVLAALPLDVARRPAGAL